MSEFSAPVAVGIKVKLLAVMLAMETYTVIASSVGMLTSNSIVFVANFVIALTGAIAAAFSLFTVKKISRGFDPRNSYGFGRLETISSLVVGLTMIFAVFFIGAEILHKVLHPVEQEGGLIGISLTCASLIASVWLWLRNYTLSRTEHSPIFEAMWRMARMGALEDLLIISAVGLSLLFNHATWAHYLDAGASALLVLSLLHSIHDILSGSVADLVDRSIGEYHQIMILRTLVENFDDYKRIHGFRTRRSGSQIFVELFLEFDHEKTMREVYTLIHRVEASLKERIPGVQVLVVPSLMSLPA